MHHAYRVIPVALSSVPLLALWSPIMVQAHQATFPPASHGILSGQSIERPMEFIPPELDDQGNPDGTRGASTRGNCATTLTALVPILPSSTESIGENDLVLGLTTQARPIFWFYISQNLDKLPLEFVLKDANSSNELVRTLLPDRDHEQGIIQIPLPESIPELEFNIRYTWSLEVKCDRGEGLMPIGGIEGSIQRVPLDTSLDLQLADSSPRDQAAIYANNGIWQEAITLLGNLYQANPDNTSLTNDWYSLLESVDLESLAQEPFADCCTRQDIP